MSLNISYRIPVLARALRQRDEARRQVKALLRERAEMALRLQLAEAATRDGDGGGDHPARTPWREIRRPDPPEDARVCVYVCLCCSDGAPAPHARHAMRALRADGVYVFCVAVRSDPNAPVTDPGPEIADALCTRGNVGWDFGAWAAALRRHPELWRARGLLLMNDSVIGPLRQIDDLWRRVDSTPAAVIGLIENLEIRRHLQSFWIYYKREALENPTIRAFWRGVRNLADKNEVIAAYELNTIYLCEIAGLEHLALYALDPAEAQPGNPSFGDWRRLAAQGYPFIKLGLLRAPPKGVDLTNWVGALTAAGLDGEGARRMFEQSPR